MTEMRQSFWSRRKAAVRAEEEAEALAVQQRAEAEAAAERAKVEAEKTDEELLAELGLPDPDTLVQGDDFSAFMKNAVPERLRRRALRTLWRSNPVLANLDGLVDHGEDYTNAATVPNVLNTTYQVGKGLLAHVEALAKAAEAKEDFAEVSTDDAAPEALTDESPLEEAPFEAPQAAIPARTTHSEDMAEDDAPAMIQPRHMRFSFADSH
ncbi:MAG: DUF3306 domain-containing protein [Pseudomonadota bacterium]|nr:DUF3306 domain-containing protein [Pseudomonadota bacterium]